jgi:apolipoprotein D and lipocalin family protein
MAKKVHQQEKLKYPTNTRPAHLKVSFFWFFYADYYVLELDEDYQWAVVGSSSDKYLWILSRTPTIDEDLKKDILNKISNRGYDIHELLWVEQKK